MRVEIYIYSEFSYETTCLYFEIGVKGVLMTFNGVARRGGCDKNDDSGVCIRDRED